MENKEIKKHVSLVAALHIGFGLLGVLGALVVFIVIGFAGSFVEGDEVASLVLHFLTYTLPFIIIFFASFGIIGGIGLLSYKAWARIVILIVAAIGCLNIPIGTAKGVYSIWVLMQDEAVELFS
ncbi:MAG: hypothetical protein ACOYXB_03770 [Bacteroidota bacterium]